ncbi:MAG: DUF2993 domain-containing protein [Cyanobacteria bacterium Co-bin8]|nr:DUF2993 domain-containing protein [Cyanobacteria bacterium Co-bin8]
MEIIAAILAGLLSIASPVGAVVDRLAEDAIRNQISGAEQLSVRIDNVPNYQLINGRVEHVRMAGRGVYPIPELRISTIDLETDPIDVDLASLQQGRLQLDEPAAVALRLVLEADDINAFLQTERVQGWLDRFQFNLPGQGGDRQVARYGLTNPVLSFLEGGRVGLSVDLQDRVLNEAIAIDVDLGLAIANGHQLQLIDPRLSIDGQEAPPQLLTALIDGANRQLTLRLLERSGIVARVLNFQIRNNELEVAVFAKVDPSSPWLVNNQQANSSAIPGSP